MKRFSLIAVDHYGNEPTLKVTLKRLGTAIDAARALRYHDDVQIHDILTGRTAYLKNKRKI